MGRLPRRGPCPGRWLGSLPLAVGLGLTIRTPRTLPATRGVSPGVSLGRESEPAAAGTAEGGGLCTRGRELENAVRAGGRLASGLGLRSATTEMPFLRLPEQSAPGHRALGYKWGGAAGRAGGRARLPRVTPREGGRKRLKAARGGGGGGKGEEMEKSVSRELIERGSEGRALQRVETDKAGAVSQPLVSSCNPRGPRVKQLFPGRSVCASLDSPGAEGHWAGECSPGLCAPRCGSPPDAQERVAKGGPGVRSTQPGRSQPARWVAHLEGGQWREKGHKFGHSGDSDSWAKPGRRVSRWQGARLEPHAFPLGPVVHARGGCSKGSLTLPSAAGSSRSPGPSGGRAHVLRSQSPQRLDSKRTAQRSGHAASSH